MRHWIIDSAALLFLSLMPSSASAQRSAASLHRAADGHPDLTGIWQVMNTAEWDLEPHIAQPGVPAGVGVVDGERIPYTPEALAQKKRNYEHRAELDPDSKCYLPGVPRICPTTAQIC